MSYSLLLLLFSSAFGRAYRLITLENVSALDSLKKAATIKPTAFYESLLYALLRMCSIFEYERTLLAWISEELLNMQALDGYQIL
jgi:hypothetical protein